MKDMTIVIRLTTGLGQMDLFDLALSKARELQDEIWSEYDEECDEIQDRDIIVTDKETQLFITPRRKAS